MKLTVLGCWAPYPRAGGACPGYLLQAAGKNILIECGNGVLSNLQKHIHISSLDAVLISHLHPDHYVDLYCLRHALAGRRRMDPELAPLPLFLPRTPAVPFRQFNRYPEAFQIHPIEDLPELPGTGPGMREAHIGGVRIRFTATDHPLATFAMVFTERGKLFYSADTKWDDSLPGFAAGADVALCEASILEQDRGLTVVGHLTATQAGELARRAGAGQLVVTHFWPEYDLAVIKAEAELGFQKSVVLAREGCQIEWRKT